MSLDARSLVKDFLPLGAGPGNLSDLKMRYSHLSESISENNSFERTLVFLSEGGLIGFILTMWFWAAVFIAGIHGWRKRRNRMAMFLLPGIFGGFIVCFVSGPDPYRPFVLWPGLSGYFLAGLLIAIACFSSTGDADASIGRLRSSERWSMIFLSGAFALMGVIYVGGKIAAVPFQTDSTVIDFEELAVQSADFSSEIEKYVTFDPLSGANWYAAGRYWFEQKQEEKALTCSQRALGLNPLAGESIYRLGVLLDRRGQVVEGEKLMLTGLKNAPFSNRLHRDYLLYLLTKGEEGKALKTLSELLLLAPEQTGFWLRYFENQDLSEIRWSDYLPRRAEVYWQYGEYLAMRREGRTADEIFKKAVKLAVSEPWVSADLFLNIAGYFMTGNRLEVALDVLRAGMEARPADVALLLTAGGVYQRLGIVYRAEELYRKALLLDPDNEEVRARLDAI
jgi:tetratricopeptide (TPR) repeat protein